MENRVEYPTCEAREMAYGWWTTLPLFINTLPMDMVEGKERKIQHILIV
jgi:hypothetical protein